MVLLDWEDPAEVQAFQSVLGGRAFQAVQEHATSGKTAVKLTCAGGWLNFMIDNQKLLSQFGNYRKFAIDVFNPSSAPVGMFARVTDKYSQGSNDRFNSDWIFVGPGQTTLTFELDSLYRTIRNTVPGRPALDRGSIKLFMLSIAADEKNPPKQPIVLYIDNLRLEDSGLELPKVDGLQAYSFTASANPVFPGFTAVTEKAVYDAKSGFGWKGAIGRYGTPGHPDELSGAWALGEEFVADLKSGPGKYVVEVCMDSTALWGWSEHFDKRKLTLNGKAVLEESMDGKTFLRDRYGLFEAEEDTPTTDIWTDRIKRICPIRQYVAEVGEDGKLSVKLETGGSGIAFLVVYPQKQEAQGQAFMKTLDAIRKDKYKAVVNVGLPAGDNPPPTPSDEDKQRGCIAFFRTADAELSCKSAPGDAEIKAGWAIVACPGERTAVQLGLYPLKELKGVKVSVTDLAGPDGAKIAAADIEVKKVRHYFKRYGLGFFVQLTPFVLQDFTSLDLSPGFTRPVWLTVNVPAKAPAGKYTGAVRLESPAGAWQVPLTVTVNAFQLEPADDVAISGMGTTAGFWRDWYGDLDAHWWKIADQVLSEQGRHGFNSVTGGPGMVLKEIKDGKAVIDFTDTDRWLEMARKHGLTKLGDSYGGLNVQFAFRVDGGPRCMEVNEANARQHYKMSFADLVRVTYQAVEEHAKEKNWPRRCYSLCDEPIPNTGNVESNGRQIELFTKNAPNTLFSGYFGPDRGREPYLKLLGVSILWPVTEEALKTCQEGKREAWVYQNPGPNNMRNMRYLYGIWMYAARQKGLTGATLGFYYPNSIPYYDVTDTEGSWGLVYPAQNGINSTVIYERLSLGVNDYRYLKTLKSRIDAAAKAGDKDAAFKSAQALLDEILKDVSLTSDLSMGIPKVEPDRWTDFRTRVVQAIESLGQAR